MVTITFGCTDDYVFTDKSIHPQPMRNFAPKWYKSIPTNLPNPDENFAYLSNRARTVKTCPSFIDVFKEGVVLLSVQDVLLKYILLKVIVLDNYLCLITLILIGT